MIELSHYSYQPIGHIYSVQQIPSVPTFALGKPKGFWVSVDKEYGWPEWCADNKFRDIKKQYHYRIILAPDSNILHISTANDMKEFQKQYQLGDLSANRFAFTGISWKDVSLDYQGIIISPFMPSVQYDNTVKWYYGWDCASGCIWDSSAVAWTELLYEPQKVSA